MNFTPNIGLIVEFIKASIISLGLSVRELQELHLESDFEAMKTNIERLS